ncbi:c-type cytochrome [Rhizobium halophytocola]|uniref:Cytochrome c556 n=1 Tax=Rhizobium halophytocola TaxID=735519 RepID=A0ABS4DWX9_9HYPH|nr:cytochrome c [Rhizobium halophytocola]MBP1850175.1 cytochrome c556 [Rhizobium halophytocola]
MNMKLVLAVGAALCLGIGAVHAADEPQVVRQAMMKKIGGAMGALSKIAKGEEAYSADTVKASLTTIDETIKAFPEQFPEGSETGMKTEASPKIWEDMDGFKHEAAELAEVAEAELAAMPADPAAVGATMKKLGAVCSDCHESYRMKK